MATPPAPLGLRIEDLGDVPEWGRLLIERLNEQSAAVSALLSGGITRTDNLAATEKLSVTFTTKAAAADTFPIKVAHGQPTPPKHVVCTRVERTDGTAITSAWSMTSSNSSDGLTLVSFQGLSNSTKYRANFTFE